MKILPVRGTADLDRFIRLPWAIYSGDGHWVPPLVGSERKMLDSKQNPFYQRTDAEHFLLEDAGRLIGRISAFVCRGHNEFHGEKTAFFGYFECENRPEAAQALFDAAHAWAKDRGMDRMRGPVNPSMNDPCGLLVDGFDSDPYVLMTYNPRYYPKLVEDRGYKKVMDLLAYWLEEGILDRDKIDRVARRVRERAQVNIRQVDLSRFDAELAIVKDIYNNGWEKTWGFLPMTDAEIQFTANDLKAIILPEYAYIAEVDGKPVGFSLALPDINRVMKKANGSLLPFGWWGFLKFNLRKIPTFRLFALGVKRDYHHLGLGPLFYQKYIEEGIKRKAKGAELSWILETNDLMNRPIQRMGAKVYKTYRMYERPLA
ncbi:MAG TPA: N-acetyltransferase [Planctomycetota bacterium]|nr:N-acetyltransferase [Planctomycetota bacterium]